MSRQAMQVIRCAWVPTFALAINEPSCAEENQIGFMCGCICGVVGLCYEVLCHQGMAYRRPSCTWHVVLIWCLSITYHMYVELTCKR
jgi:hypothetical protein